ncbi:GFA family protein [uncultured Alsobacter sp.]|uniref:GFA family protein n=1 Tax=uncultured Alsobacter sp. TaxID=1748258 RepID=UPI0025F08797|nr:GFA family protein [uncultured Alsobacter sp.]
MTKHEGGCDCGRVRYAVTGDPTRVGLCHCRDCRHESGSAFTFFASWPREAFSGGGPAAVWKGRSFCPTCGTRLYTLSETEVGIRLGSLDDAPCGFAPHMEVWVKRREPWCPALADEQYSEDPPLRP